MRGLTQKQQSIIDFIVDFIEDEGMPPTVYEIGEEFNIRPPTVFAHLKTLQNKGHITRSSKARSIKIHSNVNQNKIDLIDDILIKNNELARKIENLKSMLFNKRT